jgi:hypothetical protein
MYIITNSKIIITPNNTPYISPDFPGDTLLSIKTFFINPQIYSQFIGLQKKQFYDLIKNETKICLLENNCNLHTQNNSVKTKVIVSLYLFPLNEASKQVIAKQINKMKKRNSPEITD